MTEVPVAIPKTTPLAEPIVATDVLLLLQVPPVTASLRVVVAPAHKEVVPVMAVGTGLTVIVVVTAQPLDKR
jgi:hypothetical protein